MGTDVKKLTNHDLGKWLAKYFKFPRSQSYFEVNEKYPSRPYESMCVDMDAANRVIQCMQWRGWWWTLRTPFDDNDTYKAGLLPKSTTGWNGRPDYEGRSEESLARAICEAAYSCLTADKTPTTMVVSDVD